MAVGTLSRNYEAVLSATLDSFLNRDPIDQIFKDHVLLEVLKQKGCITPQKGGYKLRAPLGYVKNSTVSSYGGYDVLDVTPQDEFTTAFYDWKQLAGSVAISGIEEAQNMGESEIFDLLAGKTKTTLSSLREELNHQLLGKTVSAGVWSAGTGTLASTTGTDVDPIPAALSRNPTQSAAIGNIDGNTYSWWRAQAANFNNGTAEYDESQFAACTSYALILNNLSKLYNTCSKGGGGRPDLMIASQGAWEVIDNALRDQIRYTDTGKGTVGFDNVMFKNGCPVYWDEMMPDIYTGVGYDSDSFAEESIYMLNTDFMNLKYHPDKNFSASPFVKPENQDSRTSQILWYGNLTWTSLRKQGVAWNIDGSVAS